MTEEAAKIIVRCEFAKQRGWRPCRIVFAKVGDEFHVWTEREQEGSFAGHWSRQDFKWGVNEDALRREFIARVAERIAQGEQLDDIETFLPSEKVAP